MFARPGGFFLTITPFFAVGERYWAAHRLQTLDLMIANI